MLTFGIYSKEQYLKLGQERRFLGARVAYTLLRTSDDPKPEEVRMFEDLCITLHTSNGTFRTTFRGRFKEVDAITLRWIRESFKAGFPLRVQDRAVSNGLTSAEWWQCLYPAFPGLHFEASDLLVELLELPSGDATFVIEPSGKPLQYIRPPFVTSLSYPESWRNPLLRWVSSRAKKRFARLPLPASPGRPISCVHPEARALQRSNPNFRVVVRSVFERSPNSCDVLRTMNILNRAYFSEEQLTEAAAAIFDSLSAGGIWIVGRTLEGDLSNHVSILRRLDEGWEVLERVGSGSEIEEVALRAPARA
jgi:hypothetical protein